MTKKIYLLFAFLLSAAYLGLAQDKTSGIIYYDQVISLKSMSAAGGPGGSAGATTVVAFGGAGGGTQMAVPESITNKFEMLYSPKGAKFQKSLVPDNAAGGLRINVGTRDIYFNGDKAIESFELDGEQLMLENKLGSTFTVEKGPDTKVIAGYTCKNATLTTPQGARVTVWYTTDVDLKATPILQYWTEGLVLGIENDRMKFYATSIDYTKVKDAEFALPKKAKLLTQEEYDQKMKDFRAKMGAGTSTTIGPNGERRVIRMGP